VADRRLHLEAVDAEFVGDDRGNGRLARAGGADEQDVVERHVAVQRHVDDAVQHRLQARLAGHRVDRGGPERVRLPIGHADRADLGRRAIHGFSFLHL
jgi:hypothetical protein